MEKSEDTSKTQKNEEQAVVSDEKAPNVDEAKEEGDEEENEGGGDDLKAKAMESSVYVKTWGFPRSTKPEENYASWYKFFKETVQIEAPLLQRPSPVDQWLLLKFRSLEDRNKFFESIKTNKFNNSRRITAKAIAFDENYEPPERLPMSDEEALDILYPKRNTLYSEQLKEKYAKAKTLVEDNLLPISKIEKFCATKRYIKNIKTKEMVALSPIEGYENNVLISVEKNEAGEVIYGLRAVDETGTKSTIVPLEKCLGISRQMAIVTKAIVSGLPSCDLEPYSNYTKEGDLLGFTLRFSANATFMLTVIARKHYKLKFHELTATGLVPLEGDELGDSYKEVLDKLAADFKAKIMKFYKDQGKSLGITSMYLALASEKTLLYQPSSKVWSSLPKPDFVVGTKRILEKINSVDIRVDWGKDKHTEAFTSIVSLLETLNLTPATTVYLVSPLKEIGYYFSKKCAIVYQLGLWPADSANVNKKHAVSDGYKNIEYVHFNKKMVKPMNDSILIWWPFPASGSSSLKVSKSKIAIIERFLQLKVSSMVFVSYWDKDLDKYHNNGMHMEKVYSKLRINKIVPFDLEPYREGFGLFLYFKGFIEESNPATNTAPFKKAVIPPKQGGPFRKPFQPRGNPSFQGNTRMPYPPGRVPAGGRITVERPRVDPWDNGARRNDGGLDNAVRHVSVMDRLGPRMGPPADNTWTEMDQVVGVVENLQNMAEQMQAFFEQSQRPPSPPPNWSNKRKYPDDDFDRRPPREEPNWEERRGPPPGGRGYDMDYQNVDTKRRRGDMMDRAADSTGSWGNSRDSRGNFDGPYDRPPEWNDAKTASWSKGEASGSFQSGRGKDNPSGWRDSGRDPSSWRDDGRKPSTWADDGRSPSTWKDVGQNSSAWKDDSRNSSAWKDDSRNSSAWKDNSRNPTWRDDSRNSSAWKGDVKNTSGWTDEGRNTSGWKDDGRNTSWKNDGRNTSGWKDDGRNTSSWKDDGRNPSGWKDDGRNSSGWNDGRNTSGWKDDRRNSSGWMDDGRNSSNWKDDGRNTSGWKDDGRNTSGWKDDGRNTSGWGGSGKGSGATDWNGGQSSWPGSSGPSRSNPSPWEGTSSSAATWNKPSDPWAKSGNSSFGKEPKGRSYY